MSPAKHQQGGCWTAHLVKVPCRVHLRASLPQIKPVPAWTLYKQYSQRNACHWIPASFACQMSNDRLTWMTMMQSQPGWLNSWGVAQRSYLLSVALAGCTQVFKPQQSIHLSASLVLVGIAWKAQTCPFRFHSSALDNTGNNAAGLEM